MEYLPNSRPRGPTHCRICATMLPTHTGAGSGPRPCLALQHTCAVSLGFSQAYASWKGSMHLHPADAVPQICSQHPCELRLTTPGGVISGLRPTLPQQADIAQAGTGLREAQVSLIISLDCLEHKGAPGARRLRWKDVQLWDDCLQHLLSPAIAYCEVLGVRCHVHTRIWNSHVPHNLQVIHRCQARCQGSQLLQVLSRAGMARAADICPAKSSQAERGEADGRRCIFSSCTSCPSHHQIASAPYHVCKMVGIVKACVA